MRENHTTFEIMLIDDECGGAYKTVPALERALKTLFMGNFKRFKVRSTQSIHEMSVQELCIYMQFLAEMQCPFELGMTSDKQRLMASFYLDKGEREDTFKRYVYSLEERLVIKNFHEMVKLCKDYWPHREEVSTFNDKFVDHIVQVLITIWRDRNGAMDLSNDPKYIFLTNQGKRVITPAMVHEELNKPLHPEMVFAGPTVPLMTTFTLHLTSNKPVTDMTVEEFGHYVKMISHEKTAEVSIELSDDDYLMAHLTQSINSDNINITPSSDKRERAGIKLLEDFKRMVTKCSDYVRPEDDISTGDFCSSKVFANFMAIKNLWFYGD